MKINREMSFPYPLSRCQEGTALGNGYLGMLIWGEGDRLNLTLGCSGLWDHCGGMPWSPRQNYPDIRAALEAADQARIKAIFATENESQAEGAKQPSIIPIGRLVIRLPKGWLLQNNSLNLADGLVTVHAGQGKLLRIRLSMSDLGLGMLDGVPAKADCRLIPSWELGEDLKKRGFAAPEKCLGGFVQVMPNPADGAFGVALLRQGREVQLRFATGKDAAAVRTARPAAPGGWAKLTAENQDYWGKVWASVPAVEFPDDELQRIYEYGFFRFQSMTSPAGVPAGLQGPWIEDDHTPPWSSDYHFNINVQMCYWPAYRSAQFANLKRLFEMILSWKPSLRRNAKYYVGIDDGYMLPHAVDDHCICMGGFWSGTTDHASAAWIAQMMYDYYDYTGDLGFLRDSAYDFMTGVMKVYQALLEKRDGVYSLPVSTSPEYRGDGMDAWGKNSSFQQAAIHRLVRNLLKAAKTLGVEPDPEWPVIEAGLPQTTTAGKPGEEEVALWEGLTLEESHRHHSHLAALCPFGTLDYEDSRWHDLLENSRKRWVKMGTGLWTGWSYPWAVMLETHFRCPEMAQLLAREWQNAFVNRGGGFDYLPGYEGFTWFGSVRNWAAMQMDSGMGMVAALQEMLLCPAGEDTLRLFGGMAEGASAAVSEMPAPGGFRITARMQNGRLTVLKATATRPGSLRLRLPDGRTVERAFRSAGECADFTA